MITQEAEKKRNTQSPTRKVKIQCRTICKSKCNSNLSNGFAYTRPPHASSGGAPAEPRARALQLFNGRLHGFAGSKEPGIIESGPAPLSICARHVGKRCIFKIQPRAIFPVLLSLSLSLLSVVQPAAYSAARAHVAARAVSFSFALSRGLCFNILFCSACIYNS